ncbi:MAG: hypothetical protein HQ507_12320 [Candidatus Marinimicrobia bacterium]|nr:hypothetical protein [Candidatus Neomarinimicrobiota bacterium]
MLPLHGVHNISQSGLACRPGQISLGFDLPNAIEKTTLLLIIIAERIKIAHLDGNYDASQKILPNLRDGVEVLDGEWCGLRLIDSENPGI